MRVAGAAGLRTFRDELVLEGGSVEPDGEGTLLTTRQCLLHPNRNPGLPQAGLERRLGEGLGAEKSALARRRPDQRPHGRARRHRRPFRGTRRRGLHGTDRRRRSERDGVEGDRPGQLSAMRDARGRRLEVFTVPSPGVVTDPDGELMAASYVNFYVANTTVTVPVYGHPERRPCAQSNREALPRPPHLRRPGTRAPPRRRGFPLHQPAAAGRRETRMTTDLLTLGIVQCALGGSREENVARVEGLVREAAAKGARSSCPPSSSRGPTSARRRRTTFFEWARPVRGQPDASRASRRSRRSSAS